MNMDHDELDAEVDRRLAARKANMSYGKAWRPDRRWTDAIMRAIDEGRISARTVAYTALMYMDEAHVQRIAESEDYPLDMDDE